MGELTGRCVTRDCSHERLYVGRMARQSEVLLQAGHKWNNALFHNHTGLRVYPKYAMGGGYVLSGDVVDALVAMKVPPRSRVLNPASSLWYIDAAHLSAN